ncbi:MAG: helix-turn-helix domain-containing protein [Ktedonobacterales bacterium]
MQLREKLVQLRVLAGEQRGLGRPMTQMEVAEALRAELGQSLSQAYLSQLERGKRVHLSNTSREALARFFQVHPGYLVSDPAEMTVALTPSKSHSVLPGLGVAPDASGPVEDLVYRLRDHPQAERVLVLVEQILRLPPRALAELEKVGCELGGEDRHG